MNGLHFLFIAAAAGYQAVESELLPTQDSFAQLSTVDAYLVDLSDILDDVSRLCQRVGGQRSGSSSWYIFIFS